MSDALNAGGPAAEPEADAVGLSAELLAAARLAPPGEPGRLAELSARLRGVDATAIEPPARVAFWINLYNALFLHRVCLRPIRGSVLRQLSLFSGTAYEVGEERYSLDLIEHGVLRRNRRPPYRPRRPLRRDDPRMAALPPALDARLHFALNCGARSCPPINVYEAAAIDAQLDLATRSYLTAETEVDPDRGRVTLPRLLRLYRADFGARGARLALVAAHVPAVRELLERRGDGLRVRSGRFDWTVAS